MTTREYIQSKLSSFGGLTSSQEADIIASGFNLDAVYDTSTMQSTGLMLVSLIEELVLAPRISEIGDSGSRISYEYENLQKYYLWLCDKWGVTPKDGILSILGVSTIKDISDIW